MGDNIFTNEELQELKLDDLKRVATYLQIPYNTKVKKAEIIEKILGFWRTTYPQETYFGVEETPNVPTMSVRLKRIVERNGGRLP